MKLYRYREAIESLDSPAPVSIAVSVALAH
jgi:hypothetical protein